MAEEAAAMASGSGTGTGLISIANKLGWMVTKVAGFMEMNMRPVNPYPILDLIEARFALCSLCWSVMLSRFGSLTILVKTGWGKTDNSWLEFSGIG